MKYEINDYDEISRGTFTYDDESYHDEYLYYTYFENEILYVDMYNNLRIIEEGICILKKK